MMLDTEDSRQLCFDVDHLGYVVGVDYSMSVAEQKLVTEHNVAFTKEISSDVCSRANVLRKSAPTLLTTSFSMCFVFVSIR